jgi:hypothetical protein
MPEPETDLEMIERHARALGEHFDSVQIFATNHNASGGGDTRSFTYGVGNFYARYGQVTEWMLRSDEQNRIDERKLSE